ncbi:hypothetical protein PLICRDRAFT_34131 [Plicaturopsis crispa FD-325 SS-3]|nr:hypothetical protein PLICRDRAFT_34131 [Plicaturopsis crispa FD-325 SS-3]
MAVNGHDLTFACKCLNVRIRGQPGTRDVPEALGRDSAYSPVHVGDEGITVVYPQVTLRSYSQGIPVPDNTHCSRYTTLSCLVCSTIVYRAHQILPVELIGSDGPLLPTEDWVEQDVMKSSDGWIEVHVGCLSGTGITQVESCTSYSPNFFLALPREPSRSSLSVATSRPGSPVRAATPPTYPHSASPAGPYLPNMRPIFPPPPFTPSHPVFAHFAKLASQHSEEIRADTERELAQIVREKVAAIERAEAELRRDVETIWRKFRQGVDKAERENPSTPSLQHRESEGWHVGNNSIPGTPAGASQGTPVSIREFVASPNPPVRAASAQPSRRSTLSASLATSSFHHPRAAQEQSPPRSTQVTRPRSPPPYSSNPPSPYSATSPTISSSSRSSTSIGGHSIARPFRRNMDQANDTATSFRYFSILESEGARFRENKSTTNGKPTSPARSPVTTAKPTVTAESAAESSTAISNGHSDKSSSSRGRSRSRGRHHSTDTPQAPPAPNQENGVKGKRKVTFDVVPNVVTIKREVLAEQAEEDASRASLDAEDMIFDLEDDASDRASLDTGSSPLYQLQEHVQAPERPARKRTNQSSLSQSFSNLRPTSLPVPSNMRTPVQQADIDSIPQLLRPAPGASSLHNRPTRRRSMEHLTDKEDEYDDREAAIRQLVAADIPSHRGAWKKNSKAWKTFSRRQDGKPNSRYGGLIPEETEDGADMDENDIIGLPSDESDEDDSDGEDVQWDQYKSPALASSLPIAIGPLGKTREALSLASYQPKTSLSDRPGTLVPPLPRSYSGNKVASSAALRKAVYAERDALRALDPGPLDFAADDDDDEQEQSEEENPVPGDVGAGGRGRQHAYKILQKRSEVPAAGMWRSLA